MIECDSCIEPATWSVSAAYEVETDSAHRRYGTYSQPMIRACEACVLGLIEHDLSRPGTTRAFLIRKMP